MQHETDCEGMEDAAASGGLGGEEGREGEEDVILQEYHSEDESKQEQELVPSLVAIAKILSISLIHVVIDNF